MITTKKLVLLTLHKSCPECERPLKPRCCDGEPPLERFIDPTRPFQIATRQAFVNSKLLLEET